MCSSSFLYFVSANWSFAQCISHFGNECAKILALQTRLTPSDLITLPNYVGPGYGHVTEESDEAVKIMGRLEGLLLDPVYAAKAMAGLRAALPALPLRAEVSLAAGGCSGSPEALLCLHQP